MVKKLLILLLSLFIISTLTACTLKKNNKSKNYTSASTEQVKDYEIIYNWGISKNKNNPDQIKKY